MDMDAQGRVFMKFCVEKDGSISNIQVETNRTGCDEFVKEATRVLNKMPKWSPGEVSGEPKRVICRLPFNFKISN
jgi:protein TonB